MKDLLRTENGRQYGLDIFDSATVTTSVVLHVIKISLDTLMNLMAQVLPGMGTQVFSRLRIKEKLNI